MVKYLRLFLTTIFLLLFCLALASCESSENDSSDVESDEIITEDQSNETTTGTSISETTDNKTQEEFINVASRGQKTEFQIVYGLKDRDSAEMASRMVDTVKACIDVDIKKISDSKFNKKTDCEILIGALNRSECDQLTQTLNDDEYAIKAVLNEDRTSIVIAYKGGYAMMCAIDRFISEYIDAQNGTLSIPADLDVKGSCSEQDVIITSTLPRLRDPFILVEDGVYYAYGTGWVGYKNTSGDLRGEWEALGVVAVKPEGSDTNYWAPEVHKYNGAYYMFTTYHSSITGHRGCTILRSDNPEGPFVEITDGQITPHDWDAIDGTLYVDTDGQPWMIFVHEWTSTDDGIGRMAAAKLSDDLTHFISEPIELFRADDPAWSAAQITDGCWLYRCQDGQLIMLWSNNDSSGYCVGIARSLNGRVDGEWTQDKKPLYSQSMPGVTYDGGHGMIFYDTDGQMYLSIHSPNSKSGDRSEIPVFVPIREENGTLVWDIWKNK